MTNGAALLEGCVAANVLDSSNENMPIAVEQENLVHSLRRRVLSVDFSEDITAEEAEHEALLIKPTREPWLKNRLADVWLITRLAVRLYTGYLFSGLRWWIKFIRLILFVILLLPGFSQMILFYYFSPRVVRSIPYSSKPRNRLDMYLPRIKWRRQGPCPVIIYVTGGAWTIGYKAWGALFGRRLSQRGVLVFCLDYRNFPQGTALDMLQDCNSGVAWVMNHCQAFGGDESDVFLVGQSAGGHLMSLALLFQALQHVQGTAMIGANPPWDPTKLKGFVGVSGAYNLVTLADHLHRRGLYKRMLSSIMQGPDGTPWLQQLSPTHLVASLNQDVAAAVPPLLLLHGTKDQSVPVDNVEEFAAAARGAGVHCELKTYQGKSHTQPIIEDPMRGGRDELMDEVLSLIRRKRCVNRQFPMMPRFLIDAATFVCPF